jgi:multiple antibiotic resistance protein
VNSEQVGFGLHALVTLLAVVDPVGNIPFFITATEAMSGTQRRKVARQACLASAAVLLVFAVGGTAVLSVFSLTIPAVRIGGGVILLVIALRMLFGWQFEWRREHPAVPVGQEAIETGVVPLGIPLMAGPGAMSSVIVLSALRPGVGHLLLVTGVIVVVCGLSYLCYLAAMPLIRRLGRSALVTISTLMALILAALAVQFMLNGLKEAMPGLFARPAQ